MPQQSDVSEILEQMTAELREAAERVVPRFLATMPPEYFRGTDAATRLAHIKAIITTEATGLSQELILRNEDGSRITVIHERSYRGQLAERVARLSDSKPLRAARVHTARDGQLALGAAARRTPTLSITASCCDSSMPSSRSPSSTRIVSGRRTASLPSIGPTASDCATPSTTGWRRTRSFPPETGPAHCATRTGRISCAATAAHRRA